MRNRARYALVAGTVKREFWGQEACEKIKIYHREHEEHGERTRFHHCFLRVFRALRGEMELIHSFLSPEFLCFHLNLHQKRSWPRAHAEACDISNQIPKPALGQEAGNIDCHTFTVE